MTKTLIIIPCRMGSNRFPGKPLALIKGKTMIERVWESATKAQIGDVYVACCDKEVKQLLENKNIKYILTKKNLKSGTDRVYDAFIKIKNFQKYKLIINLQGDLPYFNHKYLKKLQQLASIKKFQMATLACPILSKKKILDKNIVKLVLSKYRANVSRAIYFSRLPVPFGTKKYYEHIGVYAYTAKTLKNFINCKQSNLEKLEKLEQLRALENEVNILVGLVDKAPVSIDTRNDLKNLLTLTKNKEKK